jgi:hypothetical protein
MAQSSAARSTPVWPPEMILVGYKKDTVLYRLKRKVIASKDLGFDLRPLSF